MTRVDPDEGYYFDLDTGTVSRGRTRGWATRMGPYPTRESAEHALASARARTESQDEQDDAERAASRLWPEDDEA